MDLPATRRRVHGNFASSPPIHSHLSVLLLLDYDRPELSLFNGFGTSTFLIRQHLGYKPRSTFKVNDYSDAVNRCPECVEH
jgi:hypothetical protein